MFTTATGFLSRHAFVVMPNHVHAVVQPLGGFDLETILHSWKSFTAKQCNQVLGRSGATGRVSPIG